MQAPRVLRSLAFAPALSVSWSRRWRSSRSAQPAPSRSKPDAKKSAVSTDPFRPEPARGLMWRNIGPYRGGRVTAVTGVVGQRNVFYFGGTGSGLWKSVNSGLDLDQRRRRTSSAPVRWARSRWLRPIPTSSYAGMGEGCIRGNVSQGDGVYRSVDGGRTWTHVGL